jgi:hypothetical protein
MMMPTSVAAASQAMVAREDVTAAHRATTTARTAAMIMIRVPSSDQA